jgi:hypothetical protein
MADQQLAEAAEARIASTIVLLVTSTHLEVS